MRFRCFLVLICAFMLFSAEASAKPVVLNVHTLNAEGRPQTQSLEVDSNQIGIVFVDVWDKHSDGPIAQSIEALVPRMNETIRAAHELGITLFHAVSDVPLSNIKKTAQGHRNAILAALKDPDIPEPPKFPGNSFFWPMPRYVKPPHESTQTAAPPGISPIKSHPALYPHNVHPDLVLSDPELDLILDAHKPGSSIAHPRSPYHGWLKPANLELYKTAKARGITTLLYAGAASNQCIVHRGFGAINAKRMGFRVFLLEDISYATAPNGWLGNPKTPDASMYPNRGNRDVIHWFQTHFSGTLESGEILKAAAEPVSAYTRAVYEEPSLLAYWRMNGKKDYTLITDLKNVQNAWNAHQIDLGVPGISPDDSAALFKGNQAVIVSPIHRNDLPPKSPLEGIGIGNFSVEAWVRIDGGQGKNRWIMSHDDGTREGTEFLLGVNADNRFTFITGAWKNQATFPTPVNETDIQQKKIWHVLGVQDLDGKLLTLYVNGNEVSTPLAGIEERPISHHALKIGSRGEVRIDSGPSSLKKTGEVLSAGKEFWIGMIDEVALYRSALSGEQAERHFSAAGSEAEESFKR